MKERRLGAGLVALLLAGTVLVAVGAAGTVGRAQEGVSMGVDADTTGNTATSLGSIASCSSVKTGDTFEVDIFVANVTDLLALEVYFVYDGSIVNVTDHDVQMFLAAGPGSEPRDLSEPSPDSDGLYRITATDFAEPPKGHSGSGVLVRLTLKAVGPGVSPAGTPTLDVDGNGTFDLGPFLRDVRGNPIGDTDGNGFFDGSVANARIAVDTPCPGGTPPPIVTVPPSPTPRATTVPTETSATPTATATAPPATGGEDDDDMWTGLPWIIGYVVAGAVAVLAAAVGLLAVRRR